MKIIDVSEIEEEIIRLIIENNLSYSTWEFLSNNINEKFKASIVMKKDLLRGQN